MKIMWIVNLPIGPLGEALYNKRVCGLWMDALIEHFSHNNQHKLIVATTAKISTVLKCEECGNEYYALPDTVPLLYDENKSRNVMAWKKFITEMKPDVINIWGTEFTHGLCALRAAQGTPSVIFIQGYLGAIARYYLAGMTRTELTKSITIRDRLKRDSTMQQQQKYFESAVKEREMLQLSGNIITENEWCKSSVKAILPDVTVFSCPLSLNPVFETRKWDIADAEPHSVIVTASGYPLKGLHFAIRAISILKRTYPDVKLYIPGARVTSDGSIRSKLRKRGYTKYIESLIKELRVSDNIVWLGTLSQTQLADKYTQVMTFVLTSSIENHSSSLKEAMMVGVPCVASAVGGIPEYVRHGVNGFLYQFEKYEIMASYVAQIFENDELAKSLSIEAREDMLKLHAANDIYETIAGIYVKVINGV